MTKSERVREWARRELGVGKQVSGWEGEWVGEPSRSQHRKQEMDIKNGQPKRKTGGKRKRSKWQKWKKVYSNRTKMESEVFSSVQSGKESCRCSRIFKKFISKEKKKSSKRVVAFCSVALFELIDATLKSRNIDDHFTKSHLRESTTFWRHTHKPILRFSLFLGSSHAFEKWSEKWLYWSS